MYWERFATWPRNASRWCRRNPWAASFLVALTLGVIGSAWQAIRAAASEHAARLAEDVAWRERNHAQSARNRAITSIGGLLLQDWSDRTQLNEETRLYRKALNDAGIHESQELVHELESDGHARGLLIQAYETLARRRAKRGTGRRRSRPRRRASSWRGRCWRPSTQRTQGDFSARRSCTWARSRPTGKPA